MYEYPCKERFIPQWSKSLSWIKFGKKTQFSGPCFSGINRLHDKRLCWKKHSFYQIMLLNRWTLHRLSLAWKKGRNPIQLILIYQPGPKPLQSYIELFWEYWHFLSFRLTKERFGAYHNILKPKSLFPFNPAVSTLDTILFSSSHKLQSKFKIDNTNAQIYNNYFSFVWDRVKINKEKGNTVSNDWMRGGG